MDPQQIEFIYFDLDDTLLDHRQAERLALADLCETYAEQFGHLSTAEVQEAYHRQNVVLWRRYALGEISQQDLKRLRFEQLLEALAIEGLEPEGLNTYYLDCYARHWCFSEGARDAFLTLADHYRVGVLTNGFLAVQQAKLARFPELRDRLDVTLISEEVGFLKPHPKLFAHATERAGVEPAAILYVGDSYASDVQGSLAAGWQCAWFTDQQNGVTPPGPVFRFSRWEALLQRLGLPAPDRR